MGLSTDAATESADAILSGNNLTALPKVITLCYHSMRIIRFNITFALVIKGIVLILSILGLANMWMAVLADVGITIFSVINASRILHIANKIKHTM